MYVTEAQQRHTAEIASICTVLDSPQYICSDKTDIQKHIDRHECFIALDEGRVAAVMYLICEEDSCEIDMLVSKRKGGGTALVQYAVELCKHRNIAKLWCWSMTKYGASGFYKKMGFTESYLMKQQWFGEDCFYFGKRIPVKKRVLQVAPRP